MWHRSAVVVAAMACSAASGGCVSTPVLQLNSASVRGASTEGIALDLVMRVNNNNSFDVRVRNVRAAVTLAERYQLPQIRYNPDQWLGAGRSTLVVVPVTIPWNMAQPLLSSGARSSEINYQVNGYVDVTAVRMLGIQVNDYHLEDEGSISRTQLVTAAARGFGR